MDSINIILAVDRILLIQSIDSMLLRRRNNGKGSTDAVVSLKSLSIHYLHPIIAINVYYNGSVIPLQKPKSNTTTYKAKGVLPTIPRFSISKNMFVILILFCCNAYIIPVCNMYRIQGQKNLF